MHSVGLCIASRGYDPVEPSVYELDAAVVLNRDTHFARFADHLAEVLSSGDAARHAVVVWAMDTLDEAHAFYIYVLPFPRM